MRGKRRKLRRRFSLAGCFWAIIIGVGLIIVAITTVKPGRSIRMPLLTSTPNGVQSEATIVRWTKTANAPDTPTFRELTLTAVWRRDEIATVYAKSTARAKPTAVPPAIMQSTAATGNLESTPSAQPDNLCPSISATCGQLTCQQAYACLAGNKRLDSDGDGIPCESICSGG